jgi:asparagine synthase (glutamine-hydrolysing)
VDRAAIHHYLTFQSVPAPMTAFAGVRKLPPGHWLRLREGREEVRRYWKLSFAPKFPADTPARRAGLEDRLFEEIRCAVRVRLLSDVPLGALLSGGVDSSGIVALMARERPGEPVKTFTVGFREKEYDELRFAREVSRICGTEHREFTISPGAASVLPLLVERFGEPFADSSAIPMYHITRIAREHVTVALCGDGGDESFAGYFRYKLNRLLGVARVVPPFLPRAAAALLRRLPHAPSIHSPLWISKRLFQTLALPPGVRNIRFYGHFDPEAKRALYTPEFASEVSDLDSDEIALARFRETDADNLLDATLYADIHTYLPDTLLPKVDVTSMANSMEIRSPLLDPFLMEFAARLPADFKLRRLTAKYALKRAFGRVLPERLFRRPKRGFGVPLDHWFRTELKGMVRELLLSPRTLQRGYFREEAVRRMLEEQEKNLWQWHHHLYNLMMLELWHRRFIDAAPGSERTGS